MFSQLFFLMIVSFVAAIATDSASASTVAQGTEVTALFQGLALYFSVVALLCAINRYVVRGYSTTINNILFFDNIVITSVLALFFLYFESSRFIAETLSPFTQTATVMTALLLYFFAFYACNFSYHIRLRNTSSAHRKSMNAVQFLMPFTLPLLIISFFLDLFGDILPNTNVGYAIGTAVFVAFILATMIFLPPVIIKAWKCPPLENKDLQERLDAICTKTNFGHAGYRIWTAFEDSITAAIIGVVARFRYILFTKKLLETMPLESIEAILAHEIGHNKRKHLWIFPLITLGMILTGGLALQGISALEGSTEDVPPAFWKFAEPVAFIAAMALYFRYVFGFFSRLFERQADSIYIRGGDRPATTSSTLSNNWPELREPMKATQLAPLQHSRKD